MELPRFRAALMALGKNDTERACALGITRRAFAHWKAGRLPRALRRMPPEVLIALAEDARTIDGSRQDHSLTCA